jgi:hypothetical protein
MVYFGDTRKKQGMRIGRMNAREVTELNGFRINGGKPGGMVIFKME